MTDIMLIDSLWMGRSIGEKQKNLPMDWQSSQAFAPAKVSIGKKVSLIPFAVSGLSGVSILRSPVRHILFPLVRVIFLFFHVGSVGN